MAPLMVQNGALDSPNAAVVQELGLQRAPRHSSGGCRCASGSHRVPQVEGLALFVERGLCSFREKAPGGRGEVS